MLTIQASNISKSFPNPDGPPTIAVHPLSVEFVDSQLTLIMGPSGCGKTTLISLLCGILTPSSGNINILGANLNSLSDSQKTTFRRRNIGFIFQQYNLIKTLSAVENSAVPLLADGIPYSNAIKQASDTLHLLGMSDFIHKLPRQLSGGQQQRIAIARALVHQPKILICDEPTANLDADTGKKVLEILQNFTNTNHMTTIVVTHDNRIFEFGERVILMSDGSIIDDSLSYPIPNHHE